MLSNNHFEYEKRRPKIKIIAIILIVFIAILMSGCMEETPQKIVPDPTPTPEPIPLTEIEKLELFLEEDRTDELKYDPNKLSGLNYLPGAIYVRTLAENAPRYNFHMGAIVPRQTKGVGKLTIFQDPLNYVIIDNEIIIINPQNDKIIKIDELLHVNNDNIYLTLFPDAQMATDFGQRTYPIHLDLGNDYNESQLAIDFKPL
ncbi:MAG TPA: hypothetical protein VMW20_07490 [Candidatus Nanoarchaeia archaeon]|nr:hypothetical protein [Candidatus Nanoarchaeia archaeon]